MTNHDWLGLSLMTKTISGCSGRREVPGRDSARGLAVVTPCQTPTQLSDLCLSPVLTSSQTIHNRHNTSSSTSISTLLWPPPSFGNILRNHETCPYCGHSQWTDSEKSSLCLATHTELSDSLLARIVQMERLIPFWLTVKWNNSVLS